MRNRVQAIVFGGAISIVGGCADNGSSPAPSAVSVPKSADPGSVVSDSAQPAQPAPTESEPAQGPIYAVAAYDAERDPAQDLASAVQQATADSKRILLEVGGRW